MEKNMKEAGCGFLNTRVCKEDIIPVYSPKNTKLVMDFKDLDGRFSLKLDVGLFALLDCIACAEEMPLASLIIKIRRERDPRLSLPEAASNFIGTYYYLKAHSPLRDAMPHAFGLPPLKLLSRPYKLSKSLFQAWKIRNGFTGLNFESLYE